MGPHRYAITLEQKRALRDRKRERPNAQIKELQDWFESTFARKISPSSVSEITGKKYDHLDNMSKHGALKSTGKRLRKTRWPDLEEALHKWIIEAETKITITGEIIKEKAKHIWEQLPQYEGTEMPGFSNGWLQGFQNRHRVKVYTQHGEAGSVAESTADDMTSIRRTLREYDPKDIYNCDESALFWKLVPDRSLSTRRLPGRRKDKARITIHFCCNMDGSDRLPLWIIGTAQRPRVFSAARVNIQNLNCVYRSNRKACMTSSIFEEWLRWFDKRLKDRKIVLLMDNFSGHELAVRKIQQSQAQLQNIRIIPIPPNSTSLFQPLDQGIIRTWKACWKKLWVAYIFREYDAGREAQSTMNILSAIRWSITAWGLGVKEATIQNCFRKALFGEQLPTSEPEVIKEISVALERLQAEQYIQDVMDINNFLNPEGEEVVETLEHIEERIIADHLPEEPEDSDEELERVRLVSFEEALDHLDGLRLFQEQRGGFTELIGWLGEAERRIRSQQQAALRHQDIRNYFCP